MLSHYIRSDINLHTAKVGWFSQVEKCGTGYDIMKWICNEVEQDEDKAKEICQKMLEEGFISRIDDKLEFSITNDPMYRFYEDREDLADNLLRPWKSHNISSALEVSINLVKLIEGIYRLAIVEVDFTTKIIAGRALKSKMYETYMSEVSHLSKVELNFYSSLEALCFFVNVYQCMYIH